MNCKDHKIPLDNGLCWMCAEGMWPLRDLKAASDFAGDPYQDEEIAPPAAVEPETIRYSKVLREVGLKWLEMERLKKTLLNPLYRRKNALKREIREIADQGRMEKAVHALARGETSSHDPIINSYMEVILKEEVDW